MYALKTNLLLYVNEVSTFADFPFKYALIEAKPSINDSNSISSENSGKLE